MACLVRIFGCDKLSQNLKFFFIRVAAFISCLNSVLYQNILNSASLSACTATGDINVQP